MKTTTTAKLMIMINLMYIQLPNHLLRAAVDQHTNDQQSMLTQSQIIPLYFRQACALKRRHPVNSTLISHKRPMKFGPTF
jgi:hypothetical protein